MIKSKNTIKLIICINCALLTILLLIGHNNPSIGYELNFYKSTPAIILLILVLIIITGLFISITLLSRSFYIKSFAFVVNILIIFLAKITFLLLPHIRGYYSWHGDNVTQLGHLKDILFSGNFSSNNFYPISHILLTEIILSTGIESRVVSNVAPVVFSTLFPIFIYLFSNTLYCCRIHRALSLIISSSVLIGGVYNIFFMPNGFSILLLPLVMYLLFKRKNRSYLILLLVLIIMYPYFHPLSSIFIIFTILIIYWFSWLSKTLLDQSIYSFKSSLIHKPITLMLLEITIFITWVLPFKHFETNIRNLWNGFTRGGPEMLGKMGDSLSYIGIEKWEVLTLFVKLYGASFFMIMLSVLGLSLLIIHANHNEITRREYRTIGLGTVFIITGLAYTIYLLCIPALENIGADRFITYATLLTPVFAAIILYRIIRNNRYNLCRILIVVTLIFIPTAISWISLYPSPYMYKPNAQITYQDITGTQWLFNNKTENLPTFLTLSNQIRLVEGIYGVTIARLKGFSPSKLNLVPDHFNFNLQPHNQRTPNENSYLSLSLIDRITYLTVWDIVGRFNQKDFKDINNEEAILNIYRSNEYFVYYLNSIEGKQV